MKNDKALAVQPASWTLFDEWGCDWATDWAHAERLAKTWGEPTTLWVCPAKGAPWRCARLGVN